MIEDFFHLPPVSMTQVVHLELRISPRIFLKIQNCPKGIIKGLVETDSWKKPEVENLVTLSYKGTESRNFLFQVFHESSFPKPLKITHILKNYKETFLKGQCHKIFDFWFFPWISFPLAPEYTIRADSNCLWKFAEIFTAQGALPVSLTPVANGKNLQSWKF